MHAKRHGGKNGYTAAMPGTLLLLHGWGGSKESFTELAQELKGTGLTLLIPDLPGFGAEPEPSHAWTVDDYADWVEAWLAKHRCEEPLWILGHSHGGRIAIKLAVRGTLPMERLFLCAAAGIRHARHWKRIAGLLLAKAGKFFLMIPGLRQLQPLGRSLLYKLVRVHDYERASPVMQQTLIAVTREDLRPLLAQITLPTDIFWGSDDRMTPLADGRMMHAAIRGSRLQVYEGVRHGVHRDRAAAIAAVIRSHLPA